MAVKRVLVLIQVGVAIAPPKTSTLLNKTCWTQTAWMENNMSKKSVHMLKRLWVRLLFCSCIYFHWNIQAACLDSILTNYPNIILLFAFSLGKVYVCLDFVQVKYGFTFLFFQNFRDTLKVHLVEISSRIN